MTAPSPEGIAMDDQTPPRLSQDPDAWRAGFAAARAARRGNPHPPGTREAWSWSSGYVEGEAKRAAGFLPPRLIEDGRC
jgi:hypothetical protein